MKKNRPKYFDLGPPNPLRLIYGSSLGMGPELRQLVEMQLKNDLKFYGIDRDDLLFDWTNSCNEGHETEFLDGSLENYSGISVVDMNYDLVAEGWMEFIHEGNFFLCYWEFVSTWDKKKPIKQKREIGIPKHVWKQIPDEFRANKMKNF